MRAYCQHCDRSEQIAPEEIYSPEFDFWCPRCHNILILQDDGGAEDDGASGEPRHRDEDRIREAPTRVDSENNSENNSGIAPEPPPLTVSAAEPDQGRRSPSTTAYDPYAIAAEEPPAGGVGGLASRSGRDRPTERERRVPEHLLGANLPRTRADSEEPDGATLADSGSVRRLADLAARGDSAVRAEFETSQYALPSSSRSSARQKPPSTTRDSGDPGDPGNPGKVVARETVRVRRPEPTRPSPALSEAIAPSMPPVPNWDGGDTQEVRELAASAPSRVPERPVSLPEDSPPDDFAVAGEARRASSDSGTFAPVLENDALDEIAVVETKGTTGLGSRTYERVNGEGVPDTRPAGGASSPAPPSGGRGSADDLDWFALIDEALPEQPEEAEGPPDDPEHASRVVIRLPEAMAPQSEADAEQVRQLQAKLEARGVHPENHPAQRLDPKKVDGDAKGDATEEKYETKDHFHAGDADGDDDAGDVTRASDPAATAAMRAALAQRDPAATNSATGPGMTSEPLRRAETARTASNARPRTQGERSVIEQFNRADLDPGLVCARDSSSPEADHFKQLYQRIFHSRNGASPRTILVTSAGRGEGKTTVAANLALVGARMPGKGALLIEADPRGGDLMRSFGLRMKAEGLLEALESGKDPLNYVVQFKLGMLDVLPLGIPGSDAAELISSDRIGEVIHGLSARYPTSVIIIDGSSVLHAPDPLVLARHVDGVVLVVRADSTPREQIERARDLIGRDKVLGVVLNEVAPTAL
jgi:Mrp family chromosome partitioning ATPase